MEGGGHWAYGSALSQRFWKQNIETLVRDSWRLTLKQGKGRNEIP